MYEEPLTKDGQHLYRPLDEYLNKRVKVQLPDNVTVQDYCAAKVHSQTRTANQTGIVDHVLGGD
jgi:hypothetical protein